MATVRQSELEEAIRSATPEISGEGKPPLP
jgi:hypothetical protein